MYINQGKSANEIAKMVNRNPKRVYEWIKDYNIPTRPRGSNYGQQFTKGQTSAFKGCKHSDKNKENLRQLRLKDGHVPYLIDGVHWLHKTGRKPASYRGGVTPERQQIYSSEKWEDCVKYVWKRDNYTCKRCGKNWKIRQKDEKTFEIHHLYGFAEYSMLRCNPDNLVLLCHKCHKYVHNKKNINREFLPIKCILPNWKEFRKEKDD